MAKSSHTSGFCLIEYKEPTHSFRLYQNSLNMAKKYYFFTDEYKSDDAFNSDPNWKLFHSVSKAS